MHKLNFLGIQSDHGLIFKAATYALFANSEEAGIELALSSINEQSKSFVISQDPERFSAKSDKWPQLKKAQLFALDTSFFIENSTQFISQTIEELSYYSGFRGAHLIIHFSEDLANHFEAKLVKKLLHKTQFIAERYNISLIFLFTGKTAQQKAPTFLAHSKLIDGVAHLNSHLMNHNLYFDFWRSEKGVVSQVSYQLFFEQPVSAELNVQNEANAEPVYQNLEQVFISKELLPSETKLPPHYLICDDNQSVAEHARENKAATVVLCASHDVKKTELAALCYELRDVCGPWLKIVIKNKDGVLRHHDECVFLTLGVNLILHTTTDISRLMSQVQALQGVKFVRTLPKDYKAVLAHAKGVEAKGYLTPNSFVDAVKLQREASLSTGISGVLVILDLIKGVEPIDALRLFSVKRNGDIFTANQSQVLLYLHACRENDVDNAIERLFRLAISEFFVAHSIYSQDLYIEQVCRELKHADDNKELEDFSVQLLESAVEQVPLAMSTSGRTAVVHDINRFPSRKPCKAHPLKLLENN